MPEEAVLKVSADVNGTQAAPVEPTAPAKKVLVVEDSMPLRRMLLKIMQNQHFNAFEAENGAVALKCLQDNGSTYYDLIICDLMMPVKDGAQFISEAREGFEGKLPPILICSSRSDRETIQMVMKLGVAGYVLKPFKTETVIAKVRETLGLNQAE